MELLQGPERTALELERLAQVIRQARKQGSSVEELRATIQTETPELATLADLLPKTRTELYAFLAIVLAAIQILLAMSANEGIDIPDVDVNVQDVIDVTIINQQAP